MKVKKVTEGTGYFFMGECECAQSITVDGKILSLEYFLPDECVDYPSSKSFKFKITVEAEVEGYEDNE